jgi:hypothetical protein
MHSVHLVHHSSGRQGVPIASKIEFEGAANTLRFQCPNTGREVDSGIGTRCGARLISIRVLCPLCEYLHEWQITGRNLDAVLSAENQSNDARFDNARKSASDFNNQDPELIELREHLTGGDESKTHEKPARTVRHPESRVAQNGQHGDTRGAVRYLPADRRWLCAP